VVWDATASEGILIDGTADRHFGGAGQTLGEVNMGDNCTIYAQGDVSLKSLIGTTGVWRSTTDGSIVTLAVENTSACSNMSFKDISAGAAGMIDARDACVNLGNTKGIMFKELTSIIN
jgi:hypothetical protein